MAWPRIWRFRHRSARRRNGGKYWANSGEATRPLGRACLHLPQALLLPFPCLQPLADKAVYTTITDAVLNETYQPLVTDRIEEFLDVSVYCPVHFRAGNPDRQSVQRPPSKLIRAAPAAP
jgi:hypothetical protein